jgi:hypothetical protein
MPPLYLLKDNSDSGGKGLLYVVYDNGVVRQIGPDEKNHLANAFDLPTVTNSDKPAGTVLLQVSTALRGYTTIRED